MLMPITLTHKDRIVEFTMDLDNEHFSDCGILHYLNQSIPPEPELAYFLCNVLHEGDTVVDGGANVGFFTLIMAKLVGPTGKVFAIEPDPRNLKKLRANIEANALTNVVIIDKALAGTSGARTFYLHEDSGSNSLVATSGEEMQIETVTLHGVMPWCKLVKLDLEGGEVEVLNSLQADAEYIVTEFNVQAIEAAGGNPDVLRGLVEGRGYETFTLDDRGHIPAFIPTTTKISPVRLNSNLLFSTLDQIARDFVEVRI